MEIKATKNGDALEVALSGRLDTNTSPDLEGYLRENLEGVASLAIDLADTQYVSSAGLRVFLFAHKELAKVGSGLTLRHPNEYIADVLDATGLHGNPDRRTVGGLLWLMTKRSRNRPATTCITSRPHRRARPRRCPMWRPCAP